ncbi:hypothetical protein KDL01_10840 [Actinospica durhamensis]|uniref:Uncharacterized protein n=1 Tax=Actinospica durhamensis TaxID=1508375 RepID=A0A941ETU7_9ACTN|nr:hypothetical protein [Actinospica durhamensis]MBR7833764.1 hypothetical protein [Actinospica durhamensis]
MTLTSDDPPGTWAVLDLAAEGGNTNAHAVPYVQSLLSDGWRLVKQDGSIVVLHEER